MSIAPSWHDDDGVRHEGVYNRALFAGECGELRAKLADGGLRMLPDQQSRQAFAQYLNVIETRNRARVVSRCGWHRVGQDRVFVLPGQVIGSIRQRVILQAAALGQAPFASDGTLDDWKRRVAALCGGNSRLVFSVACAFAGALLELSGDDGGGFNLKGPSRVGKTTALRAAASVWGGQPGLGAGAFIRTWRSTGNAMEGVAAAHSDTVLALDELGMCDGKELGDLAYMLSGGVGKVRADRAGAARAQARFRVIFVSTGEIGLVDKMAEAKRAVKAGMEIRFIDVFADAGVGLGIFEQLHDEPGPGALAEALKQGTRQNYGTAGPAFVRSVVDGLAADPEYPAKLAERMNDLIAGWLKPYADATGQVRSVARRFALVAIAGELASEAEITGWATGDAEEAAARLFRSWLAARGTTGAREDVQAVEQLRGFVVLHGDSRFAEWRREELTQDQGGELREAPPVERFRTMNRAGWRRWVVDGLGQGSWTYYLTREGMGEALAGLDFRAAVRVLADAGYLARDPAGKSTVLRRPPGMNGNMRLYELKPSIMGAGVDDLEDDAGA